MLGPRTFRHALTGSLQLLGTVAARALLESSSVQSAYRAEYNYSGVPSRLQRYDSCTSPHPSPCTRAVCRWLVQRQYRQCSVQALRVLCTVSSRRMLNQGTEDIMPCHVPLGLSVRNIQPLFPLLVQTESFLSLTGETLMHDPGKRPDSTRNIRILWR